MYEEISNDLYKCYKLHLFDDFPTSIPKQLREINGLLSKYDYSTKYLTFH